MPRNRQIFEAKWMCPLCGSTGKKWLLVRNARHIGRDHLKTFHNEFELDPIIKKRRLEHD